jgi:tRNA-dihydrouridine synthase
MRTGWNSGNINAPSIAKLAENSGVKMITIHGEQGRKNTAAQQNTILSRE